MLVRRCHLDMLAFESIEECFTEYGTDVAIRTIGACGLFDYLSYTDQFEQLTQAIRPTHLLLGGGEYEDTQDQDEESLRRTEDEMQREKQLRISATQIPAQV